jgi:hypothetical protein
MPRTLPQGLIHTPTSPASKAVHMEFIGELLHFLKVRKKFWLSPILIVMLVFGGLIILAQGSAVAPFIYTLF